MNKSNPLVPQGSLMEQQSKGRRRVQIWVFCVIGLHVVFLGGLLMIGCGKKDDTDATKDKTGASMPLPSDTNASPLEAASNPPPVLPQVQPLSNSAAVVPPLAPPTNPPVVPPTAPAEQPMAAAKEYKVVKGDSYYSIHKKYGVTIAALKAANPTVIPEKLKPGMTLQIPAAGTGAATTPGTPNNGGAAAPMAATDSGEVYTVKPGDNLTKIATSHHTTIKVMRSLNGLKTDRLKVGDKLKLPARASGAPVSSEPVPTAPPTIPAPVSGTGGVPVPTGGVIR